MSRTINLQIRTPQKWIIKIEIRSPDNRTFFNCFREYLFCLSDGWGSSSVLCWIFRRWSNPACLEGRRIPELKFYVGTWAWPRGASGRAPLISTSILGILRSGPLQVQVLFWGVRVFLSGAGSNFSGPVWSRFDKENGPGFHLQSVFSFFSVRSGPGFIFNICCS